MKIQRQKKRRQIVMTVLVAGLLALMTPVAVSADTSTSTNYKVTETQFGSGGSLQSCSGNYCSKQSAGDTAVGATNSTNYRALAGFGNPNEPYLEVSVDGVAHDLGILDPTTTAAASNLVKVRNYLSTGYVIQITGSPPSQGSHALVGIPSPSTSQPGSEQFGINFAANTTPSVGAAVTQFPSSEFSFGYAAPEYSTQNLFKYVNGDIVAQSDTSSGETSYTMSMILNISNVTPGGRYTGNLSAVVVPVY